MSDSCGETVEPEYDAGLVVVHGVGHHGKGAFLTRAVGPFLGRMRAEGSLRSVRSLSFPAGVDGADDLEALDVCFGAESSAPEKRLLVVEGRWADAYKRASPPQISAWVFRHELPMLWQVLRYFARSGFWLASAIAAFGFLVAALMAMVGPDGNVPGGMLLMLVSLGLAILLATRNFNWDAGRDSAHVLGIIGAAAIFVAVGAATFGVCWLVFEAPYGPMGALGGVVGLGIAGVLFTRALANWPAAQWTVLGFRLVPLAAFSYQRGVVIILTFIGMLLLPILTALLRVIAGIPGVGLVGLKGLQKLEETFFVGSNFGDMHAFADSPARFARIASAVEQGIIEVETRVKPGGTVTVLAHSGGAVVAWVLMTEPFATRRLTSRRYRIITAGGALNWAQHGFDEPDLPPISGRFVNQYGKGQTLGAHIYGTWDAVPHGAFTPAGNQPEPIIPGRFNIPARNLGEPSLSEHGEYWNNQEDVVPVIGRAIDETLPWVKDATGTEQAWNLRANARLGVVAVLTRVRVALFLAPVLAMVLLLASPVVRTADERQAGATDGETTAGDRNINMLYRAADLYGEKLGNCFIVSEKDGVGVKQPISAATYYEGCAIPSPGQDILWFAYRNATAGNIVFVVTLWLVALGLLGAYRDLFWRTGGRTDASLTHPRHGIAIKWKPSPPRFIATWIGLGIVPGLLWLVPVLAIHAVVPVDRLVYAAGLSLSASVAFAEWMYVRTLVDAARALERDDMAAHQMRPLYEMLGSDVGRARGKASRRAPTNEPLR